MSRRLSRCNFWTLGSSLVALCLLIYIAFENSSANDKSEIRWINRHLTKGEPSGEDSRNEDPHTSAARAHNSSGSTGNLSTRKDNIFVQRLDIYKERKHMIRTTCDRYGLGKSDSDTQESDEYSKYQKMEKEFPWPPQKSLMYQSSWHLLYCWIHKVASSSWSKVFFHLKGLDVPSSRLHEAAQRFTLSAANTNLETSMANSLVFTIVRHPFERLVSAYRDKFELAKKYAYVYSHFANKILNLTSPLQMTRHRRPTFSEFVDYLLREPVEKYNDHWIPYWLHCHVCEMEYDIIGKMETIQDDMDFIAKESGLAAANISLPWANKKSSDNSVSLDYFRNLTLAQLNGLYAIYKPDFEMFGYKADSYYALFKTQVP